MKDLWDRVADRKVFIGPEGGDGGIRTGKEMSLVLEALLNANERLERLEARLSAVFALIEGLS